MQHTKIFMTADPLGEAWVYALELCNALGAWNCDIILATTGRFLTGSQVREAARIPHLQLYESAAKIDWLEHPHAALELASAWLLDLAQTTQPDIIHLNHYLAGDLTWPAPVLMVVHSCLLAWWQAVRGKVPPTEWNTHRQHVRASLHNADLVIAPTQAMLTSLQQFYGPFPNAKVIYPGRRQPPFSPLPKEKLIFAAGQLGDAASNQSAIAAVAPQLALETQGWSIYGISDRSCSVTPPGQRLQAAHDSPVPKESSAQWLARASIYAFPARYAALGLDVFNAALAGCALVLGNTPSLCEIWQDAALYAPPTDHAALAATLTHLICDAKQREWCAACARKHAESFSASCMAAAYWSAYRSLIANAAVAPQAALALSYQNVRTNTVVA
ncbi:MAG: glycosyltransferase family 4 protein [Caldilineaceae bacterium]